MVPLSAFASVKTTTTPLVILHEGQFPAVTLSFNLSAGQFAGRSRQGHRRGGAAD